MNKIALIAIIIIAITSFVLTYQSGFLTKGPGLVHFHTSYTIPTNCHVTNGLPDPRCTPGATNPDVNQTTIDNTICLSGYSSSVRPPVSYTEPLKIQLMQSYGFTDSPSNYELDHLIPLEIGGAPLDVQNLWPEPRYGEPNSLEKDMFENYLHDQVCSGKMSLQEAQNEIATDWAKYWHDVVNRN